MAGGGDGVLDLRALDVPSGGAVRADLEVALDALTLAGQRYAVGDGPVPLRLDVSRSPSGWLFRLRLATTVTGPCARCLGQARVPVEIDMREFAATGRGENAPFDDDLDSEYLTGETLDAGAWARDAVAEALPDVPLCRDDCAGLCPTCGADLNPGPCPCPAQPPADPRWGPLAELAERMRHDDAT